MEFRFSLLFFWQKINQSGSKEEGGGGEAEGGSLCLLPLYRRASAALSTVRGVSASNAERWLNPMGLGKLRTQSSSAPQPSPDPAPSSRCVSLSPLVQPLTGDRAGHLKAAALLARYGGWGGSGWRAVRGGGGGLQVHTGEKQRLQKKAAKLGGNQSGTHDGMFTKSTQSPPTLPLCTPQPGSTAPRSSGDRVPDSMDSWGNIQAWEKTFQSAFWFQTGPPGNPPRTRTFSERGATVMRNRGQKNSEIVILGRCRHSICVLFYSCNFSKCLKCLTANLF